MGHRGRVYSIDKNQNMAVPVCVATICINYILRVWLSVLRFAISKMAHQAEVLCILSLTIRRKCQMLADPRHD